MATERHDQQQHALDTTEDAFLGGALIIEQSRHGSRAGIDAIFLAASAPAKAGQRVLDLGSGSGIVALAIATRVEDVHVAGVEIDPTLCELARRNASRNGLSGRVAFFQGDVTRPVAALVSAGLDLESFNHAVANPPFLAACQVRLPKNDALRRAHTLEAGELEQWVKFSTAFLKPGGTVTMIHRPDALPQLLTSFKGRIGGICVYPLFPREGESASRILIRGIKGSRAPLTISPGMVLHKSGSRYTIEADAILRRGLALEVTAHKSHFQVTASKNDAC